MPSTIRLYVIARLNYYIVSVKRTVYFFCLGQNFRICRKFQKPCHQIDENISKWTNGDTRNIATDNSESNYELDFSSSRCLQHLNLELYLCFWHSFVKCGPKWRGENNKLQHLNFANFSIRLTTSSIVLQIL